jgi:hypothetical protein
MNDEAESERPVGLGSALNLFAPSALAPMASALSTVAAPTLEQEVRRLIAAHGAEAVREELRLATKRPRGRVPEKDWPLLAADLKQDARDWLEGRDPFARSNYSIATRIAKEHPGHSAQATYRRILRKLAAKRKSFLLYTALALSEREYPFGAYLRTLEALAAEDEFDLWQRVLELDRQILTRYREIYGEPDSAMTWKELESKPRYHPNNALAGLLNVSGNARGGMFAGKAVQPS